MPFWLPPAAHIPHMTTDVRSPRSLSMASSIGTSVVAQPRVLSRSVLVTVVTIALSGATYGLENSLMSPLAAMPEFVKKYQGLNRDTRDYTFTASHQSMIFSIPLIGTIFGALLSPVRAESTRTQVVAVCGVHVQHSVYAAAAVVAESGRLHPGPRDERAGVRLRTVDRTAVSVRRGTHEHSRWCGGELESAHHSGQLLAAICCWASDKNYNDTRSFKVRAVQAALPFLLLVPTHFCPNRPCGAYKRAGSVKRVPALKRVRPVSDAEIEQELQDIVRAEQERKNLVKNTSSPTSLAASTCCAPWSPARSSR